MLEKEWGQVAPNDLLKLHSFFSPTPPPHRGACVGEKKHNFAPQVELKRPLTY